MRFVALRLGPGQGERFGVWVLGLGCPIEKLLFRACMEFLTHASAP